MVNTNFDNLSLKQLVALDQRIKAAIGEARARESKDLKAKIAQLAEDSGFSIAELYGARGKSKSVGVAKYANPDDASDTWTGRGRKPTWLVSRLKKGAKIESFEI